jgi:hypothetical protein
LATARWERADAIGSTNASIAAKSPCPRPRRSETGWGRAARGVSVAGGASGELVDGYDVAGVGELVDVEVGGMDETGGRHVVGLDGPGGDGVVVPADAVPIPGGEDVGGAAVLRAGEVAVAVQLVAVLPVAAVVGAVVFVVAVAVVVAGGVVGGVVGVAVLVAALVLVDVTGGGGVGGGGAGVVPGAAVGVTVVALGTVVGAAVLIGAAVLGSMAGGGAGCCVDGGGATVTGGGVTGSGTGRGTICGTQVTDPYVGGFTGAVRLGVPVELRGVSDTHGTLDDDPEGDTCWP